MELSNRYKRVPLEQIVIKRDSRQRRVINTDGLRDSISQFGVIQPIVITKEFELVAGERRYTASKELGLPDIPCRFADELSPWERQVIELEENLKRSDLPWRDMASAVLRLHELHVEQNPDWTQAQTAKTLSLQPPVIAQYLRVARELQNPKISQATGIPQAYNILTRRDQRAASDAISEILEAAEEIVSPKQQEILALPEPKPKILPVEESILEASFLEWAPQYSGPKFNFIHCDFPYGVGVFEGNMSGRQSSDIYSDSPESYWQLVDCLCANLDRLMSHSAHLMFWFSMEYYQETLDTFAKKAPSLAFQAFPVIWTKSDNVGILPDSRRGPRRVYETALIASREDRFIVKAIANAYPAPTDRRHHPSTKPEPMLRHFFQMFVDENTRMLDPTCGSGSALRAAESMGAKYVLGLENHPEHCQAARSALRQFRALRSVSK